MKHTDGLAKIGSVEANLEAIRAAVEKFVREIVGESAATAAVALPPLATIDAVGEELARVIVAAAATSIPKETLPYFAKVLAAGVHSSTLESAPASFAVTPERRNWAVVPDIAAKWNEEFGEGKPVKLAGDIACDKIAKMLLAHVFTLAADSAAAANPFVAVDFALHGDEARLTASKSAASAGPTNADATIVRADGKMLLIECKTRIVDKETAKKAKAAAAGTTTTATRIKWKKTKPLSESGSYQISAGGAHQMSDGDGLFAVLWNVDIEDGHTVTSAAEMLKCIRVLVFVDTAEFRVIHVAGQGNVRLNPPKLSSTNPSRATRGTHNKWKTDVLHVVTGSVEEGQRDYTDRTVLTNVGIRIRNWAVARKAKEEPVSATTAATPAVEKVKTSP